jgi:hypothetical protein
MKNLPALPVVDPANLGPAMQALSPLQRGFVLAKVYYGLDDRNAARAAGYAESFSRHHAHEVAHRADVQAAILECGKALLRGEGAKSIRTMVEIRDNAMIKPETRLKAAIEIANRSGFHITTEHHEHVHQHLSEAETDRRILALAAELGLPPEQSKLMLIAPADFERNAEGVFVAPSLPRNRPNPATIDDPRLAAKRAAYARRKDMTPDEREADKRRIQAERSERMKRERAEFEALAEVPTPEGDDDD